MKPITCPRNPDVAAGISLGDIRSAREHFVDHGYFEGRLPYRIEVDETWYKENHPDLADSIGRGQYRTGQDHFDGPGYPEGRRPFPPNRSSHLADTAPDRMTFAGSEPPALKPPAKT